MTSHFQIPAWANGPDGSANGGYTAGCVADACRMLEGAVEVNLRLPPPLASPLAARWDDHSQHWNVLTADQSVVATARRANVGDMAIPPAVFEVDPERAAAATANFPYIDAHPFPRCLCCGTERSDDAPALNIHCGRVDGTSLFAGTWTPGEDLSDDDLPSFASRAATFSALDCPSATPFADPDRPAVLARYEVQVDARPRIGDRYVLAAWELARDGRKLFSASVLIDWSDRDDPQVIGRARALWIEVRTT